MILIESTDIMGWEAAIRGMRNPMNSWGSSDSKFEDVFEDRENLCNYYLKSVDVGPNDHNLMMKLAAGGPVHAKYRRMITVYLDITAPLYWWKEFDTYKVGTVANSCSTMHKIQAKKFTIDDFSHEHLEGALRYEDEPGKMYACYGSPFWLLQATIEILNEWRELFNNGGIHLWEGKEREFKSKDKDVWWQMIQLLPSSYNQKRTIMLNYEVLAGIYPMRKDHKLDEWREFCKWIEQLPYSEIITCSSPAATAD